MIFTLAVLCALVLCIDLVTMLCLKRKEPAKSKILNTFLTKDSECQTWHVYVRGETSLFKGVPVSLIRANTDGIRTELVFGPASNGLPHHLHQAGCVEGKCIFSADSLYPWCVGNPTKQDCIKLGYCTRNPSCGD